jgi:hypothetical protein
MKNPSWSSRVILLVSLFAMVSVLAQQTRSQRPRPEAYKANDDYIEALVEWKVRQMMPEIMENVRREGIKSDLRNVEVAPRSPCIPTIESRIKGEYKGWDGNKIYELQNGQIWKQGVYHYHYHYAYSPEVKIFYTDTGCLMKVEDDDDEGAIVTRLR